MAHRSKWKPPSSFTDGGVARLRIHGEVHPDFTTISPSTELDLAAMVNGGICIGYSCSHYGHAKNVIAPGRARRMDEGESHDMYIIIKLISHEQCGYNRSAGTLESLQQLPWRGCQGPPLTGNLEVTLVPSGKVAYNKGCQKGDLVRMA